MAPVMRVVGPVALACFLVTSLGGCGLIAKTKSLFGGKIPLEVSLASDLNQNSPLAVDVIVVYNKKLLEKLLEMPAAKWFEGREQFWRDHPKGHRTWSWEWVPGQRVEALSVPYKTGAKAAIIFADYFSPGEHRTRINHRRQNRLIFGPVAYEVVEQ